MKDPFAKSTDKFQANVFSFGSLFCTIVTLGTECCFFLARHTEKSDVLLWVRNLLSHPSDLSQGPWLLVSLHWLYRTSRNFVVKRRHKNVRMTSYLFKMADVKGI